MMQKLMQMLGVSQEAVQPEDTYTCVDTVCGGLGRVKQCDASGRCTMTGYCC